ncbi:hypothetical protein [Rufibacter psychrotolerans]|uniref:hypothetical protein n=1 Tax=Rufibacter psychrotolerans TaxID=2812556 RepID=UPI0019683E4C|nr:hypothetical protein [Rufibacter sp. SYSU D00308]
MNKIANKIKLNNNLWFTILGNKLVFGNSFLSKGFHYTFSFGNRSGIFDLHLTNSKGEHYTVLEISHQNIYEILPHLLVKIKKTVFDLSNFEESKCNKENLVIYKIEQFSVVASELGNLTRKNKVIIDKDSLEFKCFTEKLTETQTTRIIDISDIKNESQFLGIVKSKTESYFIMKSPFLEDQIFRINNIYLDINSVFEKILGKEVYETILNRINDGILHLKE